MRKTDGQTDGRARCVHNAACRAVVFNCRVVCGIRHVSCTLIIANKQRNTNKFCFSRSIYFFFERFRVLLFFRLARFGTDTRGTLCQFSTLVASDRDSTSSSSSSSSACTPSSSSWVSWGTDTADRRPGASVGSCLHVVPSRLSRHRQNDHIDCVTSLAAQAPSRLSLSPVHSRRLHTDRQPSIIIIIIITDIQMHRTQWVTTF